MGSSENISHFVIAVYAYNDVGSNDKTTREDGQRASTMARAVDAIDNRINVDLNTTDTLQPHLLSKRF